MATSDNTKSIVKKAVQEFFNEGLDEKRFLDVARIPFICDDIRQIKQDMKTLTRLIYVGVGIVTTITAIIPLLEKFVK